MVRRSMLICLTLMACDREPAGKTDAPPEAPPSATAALPSAAITSTATSTASATASAQASAPAVPLYYERAITEDDLSGRSLRELSLLRNTVYARAGNRFRRPWLHDHFSRQPWYAPKDAMDQTKITALDRENARKVADFDAALTREELETRREAVLGRLRTGTGSEEDRVELSLLSQRMGVWLGEGFDNEKPTPLEDPSRLDALLTVEELSTLSRRDLRILRNTVYARRGRSFDSAVVRGYFEGASWYRPREDFHDGMLTAIDQKNIQIIRSVEDSLGGPLHENPDYGKDGWFFAA